MNKRRLDIFRDMDTIPEGFFRTDGTYIYIVGPIVTCQSEFSVDERNGVTLWWVNVGILPNNEVCHEPSL